MEGTSGTHNSKKKKSPSGKTAAAGTASMQAYLSNATQAPNTNSNNGFKMPANGSGEVNDLEKLFQKDYFEKFHTI